MLESNTLVLENAPSVVTWWALSGDCARDAIESIRAGMLADGYAVPELPEPSPRAVLRRALRVFEAPGVLIRSDKTGKYAVVHEKWIAGQPSYNTIAMASVDEDAEGDVEIEWSGDDEGYEVLEHAYARALKTVAVEEMSSWVLSVAHTFNSIRVRESGGVYYMLDGARWDRFRHHVHEHTSHVVHALRVVNTESAIDTVVAALHEEISSLTDEALAVASEKGQRAIGHRRDLLDQAEKRVRLFERAFGRGLDAITEEIQRVDAKCVEAIMRLEMAHE